MNGIIFTVRSVTNAQRMRRVLEHSGIGAEIIRPDIGLSQSGCAYAVRISEIYFAEAVDILKSSGMYPNKAFSLEKDGKVKEVFI